MSGVLRAAASIGRYLILPALFAVFVATMFTHGPALDTRLPHWDVLMVIAAVTLVERIFSYNYAVSQKSVLARSVRLCGFACSRGQFGHDRT